MPKRSQIIAGNVPLRPSEPQDGPEAVGGMPEKRGPGRPRKKYAPKLSADEQLMLLKMRAAGQKCTAIARILSLGRKDTPISPRTIMRYLQQVELPQVEVQQALSRLRMRAVESWERAMETGEQFGKHTPAKDLLQATGTIRQDQAMDRLIIVVGDGSRPIGELPAIPAEFRTHEATGERVPQLPALPPAED